jgi:hypothetical protein
MVDFLQMGIYFNGNIIELAAECAISYFWYLDIVGRMDQH